jgi:tetraacyldisaccharide 4'-kinase
MMGAKDLLTPFSVLYQAGVRFRHFLYDQKILPKQFAPLPVVSIGNVMAGGVGKTQVALLLAGLLAQDLKVAILSRGYRGQAEHVADPLLVDVNRHAPSLCGDEPWLLASRLDSVFVVVNKNRFKSALKAKKLGAQAVLLDDGMQHRQLHRDFEIVVVDGKIPFGSFLPKGRLREDLQRLKTADLILFVGAPSQEIEGVVTSLALAPQVVAKVTSCGLFQLDGGQIDSIKGKKVAVFCGIGNPARFVNTVEELGAQVVATHFSSDHRLMGEKRLFQFASHAQKRGATLLLCTEKDKVKLSKSEFPLPVPVVWVKATLVIVKNQHVWLKMVDEIKLLASRHL